MIANPLPRNLLFLLSRHLLPKTPAHGRFVHGALVKLRFEFLAGGKHHVGELLMRHIVKM